MWKDFTNLYLKHGANNKAELVNMRRIGEALEEAQILQMTALSLQNDQFAKSQTYLHKVLKGVLGKWKDINSNLLMGFIYEAMKRPGMSRKHFAIAKVVRMRELG